jgi:hypothetical protein
MYQKSEDADGTFNLAIALSENYGSWNKKERIKVTLKI